MSNNSKVIQNLSELSKEELISYIKQLEEEVIEYQETIDELNQKMEIMNLDVIAYHNIIKGLNELNPDKLVESRYLIAKDEEITNLTKELNEYKEALREKNFNLDADSQELILLKTELLEYKKLYEKFNSLHPNVLK